MVIRARVFVDFWNFQLQWNARAGQRRCDWRRLPLELTGGATKILAAVEIIDSLRLEETRVYASYSPSRESDSQLRNWLGSFLSRQPSYRVIAKERREQQRPVRCSQCGHESATCPSCGRLLTRSVEKGVDTALVTDLLTMPWSPPDEIAVLVSSDSDLVPGVERLQDRGVRVVNATWRGHGHHLAKASWAALELDEALPRLYR